MEICINLKIFVLEKALAADFRFRWREGNHKSVSAVNIQIFDRTWLNKLQVFIWRFMVRGWDECRSDFVKLNPDFLNFFVNDL